MFRSKDRRFTELQEQNAELQRLLREAVLEKALLKELAEGKFWPRHADMKSSITLYPRVIRRALPAGWSGYPPRRNTTPANTTRSLAWISTPLCVVG